MDINMLYEDIKIGMKIFVEGSDLSKRYGPGVVKSVYKTACNVVFKDKYDKEHLGIYSLEDLKTDQE